jgi:hypothetical protein
VFSCDLFFLFIYIAQYPLHSASRILVGVSRSYDLFLVFVFKRKNLLFGFRSSPAEHH